MDVAWLVGIGVLLLVAGLCTLAYDTLRKKQDNHPYPFPDSPTARLEDTSVQPRQPSPPPQESSRQRPTRPSWLRRQLSRTRRHAQGRPPRSAGSTKARKKSSRALAVPALLVGVLVIACAVGAIFALAPRASAGDGTIVIGICQLAGDPSNIRSATLADDILKSAAASGIPALEARQTRVQPGSPEAAQNERARLKADLLWWGEIASSGNVTASLVLGPDYSVGQQKWEEFSGSDADILLFPQHFDLSLPAGTGTDPIVPLTVALVDLRLGNYSAGVKAAGGARATIEATGNSSTASTFVEAIARTAAGEYDAALQLFGKIETSGDVSPEMLVDRAVARLRLSDYAGARADAERAMSDRGATDRTQSRAYLLRGEAHMAVGELSQARSDLEESARLDGAYLLPRLNKAEVLYRQAQPDTARAELEAIIKAEPDAAPAYRLLGLVRLMLGQPEEALSPLGRAEKIYGNWIAQLRVEEGKAAATGGKIDAQKATAGIVMLNRELAGVYLYQGMALSDKARKEAPETFLGGIWRHIRGEATTAEQALARMREAGQLDPKRADIPLQEGNVYTQLGDAGKAAEAFDQARALDPAAPEPYMSLAHLQETQGNTREAAKTLESLLDNAPRHYPAYQALHELYTSLGDQASAAGILQRALAVAPQTAQDHLWRGKFYRLLEDKAGAMQEFRLAAQDAEVWEAHLEMGQIFQGESQGPAALAEYQAVLERQPNEPTALLNAGRLLVLAGQPEDAQKLFQRLTTLAPDNVEGHLEYLQLLVAKGDYDKAVAEGRRAVQVGGARADGHFFLGIAWEARQDWSSAAAEFKEATQRDPKHFEAFIRMTRALFRDDRYAESMEAAASALQLRGDDPQPYRWKAESQLALGDVDGALLSLDKCIQINGVYADALALASRGYMLKGDEKSAIEYANRAAGAEPHNPAGFLALGELHLARGRSVEAQQAFASALEVTPGLAAAIAGQGRAYALAGDNDKAINLYANASKADPHFAEAHLYSGHAWVDLGRWDDALREYRNAVQMRPHWPVALYYLGRAYLQRKDLPNAQAAFAKATQFSPNMIEAWFGLGITNRDRGQKKEAIDALVRAVQLNSNYSEAWLYLGLTYEEAGQRGEAADAFSHARDTATESPIKEQAEQGLLRVK